MQFPDGFLEENASRSEADFWDALSAPPLKGKLHPILRLQTGTQFPPATGIFSVSPDKTCQNKPVPFWQGLEADGEGDLMVVTGYCSGASVGLGDGAHDG